VAEKRPAEEALAEAVAPIGGYCDAERRGLSVPPLAGLVGVAGSNILVGNWSQSMKREFKVVYYAD
jgi:hypothetical protein